MSAPNAERALLVHLHRCASLNADGMRPARAGAEHRRRPFFCSRECKRLHCYHDRPECKPDRTRDRYAFVTSIPRSGREIADSASASKRSSAPRSRASRPDRLPRMADSSFDIVSKVDHQEAENALQPGPQGDRAALRLQGHRRLDRVERRGGPDQGEHRGAREGRARRLPVQARSSAASR